MQGSESFRLVVRRGPQPNQAFEMTKDVITLGRDITNDIVINDPEVSRHHLRLTKGVTGYNIEDLGSTNGTFIGGQRISGVRELKRGDMIGLGETVTLGYESARPVGAAGAEGDAQAPSPYARPDAGQAPAQPEPAQPSTPDPQAPYGQQYGNTQDYGAPQPQQPPQPAQPYDQQAQQGGYAPPPQDYGGGQQPAYSPQAPGYEYDPYQVREEEGGNSLRWILIGCGLLFVFCCCATTIGAVIIDAAELWDDIPIIRDLEPTFADIAEALGFID